MRVVVLGRGRVGRGLHRALRGSTIEAELRSGRTSGSRLARACGEADAVVLAVPDAAIHDVAARIAPSLRRRTAVVHCAGARDTTELEPCREAGASVGAMHPLISFPDPKRPPRVDGAAFLIAGEPGAVKAARRIAKAAGGRAVVASIHGPAYHAAAALVANGAAALCTAGVAVIERLGVDRRSAERAVGALLRTVADNVERIGVPQALTGPVMRGDARTVSAHRRALRGLDPKALSAYDGVAPAILSVAREAGLSEARARAVRRALSNWPRGVDVSKRA